MLFNKRQMVLINRKLREIDPEFKEVLFFISIAGLYKQEENSWKDTEIEGPLYFYKRATGDLFVSIFNKKGLEFYVFEIQSERSVTHHEKFLSIHGNKNTVYGLWFMSEVHSKKTMDFIISAFAG